MSGDELACRRVAIRRRAAGLGNQRPFPNQNVLEILCQDVPVFGMLQLELIQTSGSVIQLILVDAQIRVESRTGLSPLFLRPLYSCLNSFI